MEEFPIATVKGVGGVFVKCKDKDALSQWYQRALGIRLNPHGAREFPLTDYPNAAYCVWGPFKADTKYFEPSDKKFMINLIVDDVEGMLQQIEANGGQRSGEIEDYSYGRSGWFIDPEGNKVELWQVLTPSGQQDLD